MSERETRASDAERNAVVGALYAHAAAGRLAVEEMSERTEAAVAARTRGDLQPLLADLPEDGEPPARAEPASRIPSRQRTRWAGYGAVVAICLVVWAVTSITAGAMLYFWPIWVAGPWGVALLAKTFGPATPCSRRHRQVSAGWVR